MVRASSDNLYGPPNFIVDASAAKGTHTTIASAIADAVSGQTIFIRPGSYAENFTAKGGVNLTGYLSGTSNNSTRIAGKITIDDTTGTDPISISNISFTSAGGSMVVTADAANSVNTKFFKCNFVANGANAINDGGNGKRITFEYCQFNLETAHTFFTKTGNAQLKFVNCDLFNDGGSTTACTASAGTVSFNYSGTGSPITTSGSATCNILYSRLAMSNLNVTAFTHGGSGGSITEWSTFESGTASAISVGTGSTLQIRHAIVNSSNTNAITGAGTVLYAGVFFQNSSTVNTTTTSQYTFEGGVSWQLIETTTASASAAVDFLFPQNSSYSGYKVVITNLSPSSDGVNFAMRTSTDGGSTFSSGASDYGWVNSNRDYTTTASSNGDGDDADSIIQLNDDAFTLGSAANEISEYEILLYRPSVAKYTSITYNGLNTGTTGIRYSQTGAGTRFSAADVDAIRFLMSSGNIAIGTFYLYGLVN